MAEIDDSLAAALEAARTMRQFATSPRHETPQGLLETGTALEEHVDRARSAGVSSENEARVIHLSERVRVAIGGGNFARSMTHADALMTVLAGIR